MLSSGTQAADFIKVLYPTLQAANLSTQIACCDSEGWNNQITMTAQLKAAGVENMLGVVTSHAYSSQVGATINTTRPVWETEYADLSGALLPNNWYNNGGTGEGMTWANYIYNGVVNSNLSAYLYWIGAEPGNTNSALVLTSGTTTTASKRLWAFAQWGRYVRPGAIRLGTSGSTSTVKFSAFRNTDGSFSVQVSPHLARRVPPLTASGAEHGRVVRGGERRGHSGCDERAGVGLVAERRHRHAGGHALRRRRVRVRARARDGQLRLLHGRNHPAAHLVVLQHNINHHECDD